MDFSNQIGMGEAWDTMEPNVEAHAHYKRHIEAQAELEKRYKSPCVTRKM